MHTLELAEFNEVSTHDELFEDRLITSHELRKLHDLAHYVRQQGHLQVESMHGGLPLLLHVLIQGVASPGYLG